MTETAPLLTQQPTDLEDIEFVWKAFRHGLVKACTNEIPLWWCKWMKLESEKALWIATMIGVIIHMSFLGIIGIFLNVNSILSIIGIKYKAETFNRAIVLVVIGIKLLYDICKEMGVAYSEIVEKREREQRELEREQRDQEFRDKVIRAIEQNNISAAINMLSPTIDVAVDAAVGPAVKIAVDAAVGPAVDNQLSDYSISRTFNSHAYATKLGHFDISHE
jgi:Sec-independent protein translocase protein TatA